MAALGAFETSETHFVHKQINDAFRHVSIGKTKPEIASWANESKEIQIFGLLQF